ncbi:hypothetical protein G7Y89_g8640 [Cudoniella acicularis]|uniref:Protein kinase domain-containing protein n=1 Tax=Cudoniella acicularis TaxID=354080 RepID=A0A8H4RG73_9HELO|nr:hypothetical protein G7Y89_g8640 [Cudoniella acicularis]
MTQIKARVKEQENHDLAVDLEHTTDMASIPSFEEQENLFTDDPEKSRIEFLAAKAMQVYNRNNCADSQTTLVHNGEKRISGPNTIITDPDKIWQLLSLRATNKNPVYAFFIRQKNSNSRLLLSRDLLQSLIVSNNIFGRFGDFVMSFGWKKREHDIGPPPCRFQAGELRDGDSFTTFECAYGIRYVERNGYGESKDPWSVRQTTIYHKYHGETETWVFISASRSAEAKVTQYIKDFPLRYTKNKNPFDLHVVLIDLALENWRWYIKSLVERIAEYSSRIIAATVGKGKNSFFIGFELNVEDRQMLKIIEDKALDMLTIFESMTDTISTLLQEYEYLRSGTCTTGRDKIILRLKESLREVELYRKKAKTLHRKTQGTASLLSDLLDYQNAKIAEGNGDSLRILAEESREENSTMRMLTEKSTNDAAAVKVITLITIVFLPTTVVSGFFSTQFVHPSEDGHSLDVLENWWIIAAISIPLTIITFAIWYCWIRFPWQRWWDETRRKNFRGWLAAIGIEVLRGEAVSGSCYSSLSSPAYYSRQSSFVDLCIKAFEGTTPSPKPGTQVAEMPGLHFRRWLNNLLWRQNPKAHDDRALSQPVNGSEPLRSHYDFDEDQANAQAGNAPQISPSHLPNGQIKHPTPEPLPASFMSSSPSNTIPRIPYPDPFLYPSESNTPNIKPLARSKTLSPHFGTTVKVSITTEFRGQFHFDKLSLPSEETSEERYKRIEGTAKEIGEKLCRGTPSGKELSLLEGFCVLSCRGGPNCGIIDPERFALENLKAWKDVETILANYEDGAEPHWNLEIAITRKLDLTKKLAPMVIQPPADLNFKDWLWVELERSMVSSAVERNLKYLPNEDLQAFTHEDIITGVCLVPDCGLTGIQESRTALAQRIYRKAPKLFAIAVYGRIPLSILEKMLDEGVGDEILPLDRDCPSWIASDRRHWGYYRVMYDTQWALTAAVFYLVGQHQTINANVIIPFLLKDEHARGNFSVVYKIKLEHSHQRLYSLPNDPNPELALKVIDKHRKNTSAAFKNEQLILKGLQELTHDHIIKLLGTYEQEDSYHFLFPFANYSLEEYMRTNPTSFDNPDSSDSRRFITWVVTQFQGIASGLAQLHVRSQSNGGDKANPNSRSQTSLKPPELTLVNPEVAKNQPVEGTGYHHDIKPQNILWFSKISDLLSPITKFGILQIADFGIGKFHSLHSGTGTSTVRGTPTYAAPESKIPRPLTAPGDNATPTLKLSRPYDVWSLGCVLMEVLVWLVFGSQEWKKFNEERDDFEDKRDESYKNDGFFYVTKDGQAMVRESVTKWQRKLRDHPRLHGTSGASLLGLLKLVERILNIDPDTRISANELSNELSNLLKIDAAEALPTIAESPPPSRTGSPDVRVSMPEMVKSESAADSASSSPIWRSRQLNDSTTSLPQRVIRSDARPPFGPPASSINFPPPSRSGTANSMSRPSTLSSATSLLLRGFYNPYDYNIRHGYTIPTKQGETSSKRAGQTPCHRQDNYRHRKQNSWREFRIVLLKVNRRNLANYIHGTVKLRTVYLVLVRRETPVKEEETSAHIHPPLLKRQPSFDNSFDTSDREDAKTPKSPPKIRAIPPPRQYSETESSDNEQSRLSSTGWENFKEVNVPPDARWTKFSRKLVNPEALELGKERYEVRQDFVVVLRVLSRDEVQSYAKVTQRIQAAREEAEMKGRRMHKDRLNGSCGTLNIPIRLADLGAMNKSESTNKRAQEEDDTESKASGSPRPQSAAERLVSLLLDDNVIKSLCADALCSVAQERFERNLRRQLKEFAVGLRKEVDTEQERHAAHFVRPRPRNSAYMLEKFIKASKTFERLRENLRAFVRPTDETPHTGGIDNQGKTETSSKTDGTLNESQKLDSSELGKLEHGTQDIVRYPDTIAEDYGANGYGYTNPADLVRPHSLAEEEYLQVQEDLEFDTEIEEFKNNDNDLGAILGVDGPVFDERQPAIVVLPGLYPGYGVQDGRGWQAADESSDDGFVPTHAVERCQDGRRRAAKEQCGECSDDILSEDPGDRVSVVVVVVLIVDSYMQFIDAPLVGDNSRGYLKNSCVTLFGVDMQVSNEVSLRQFLFGLMNGTKNRRSLEFI